MTKYGRSPWVDRFSKARIPAYPRQRGALRASVVIVGGGLTGCATAYACAAAGVNVVLVEAEQIGRGSTGSASGWISGDPGVFFLEVEKALGLKRARHAFQSWRRAALDFAALLRRLDIKCGLESTSSAIVAITPDQAARLKRDHKARRDAGIDVPFLGARVLQNELALGAVAAIRDTAGGELDPYRACLGLAAAAADRGAKLFERSPVRKITFNRRNADVVMPAGSIRADRVVIATGRPTALCKALARHFWFQTGYLTLTERVPAKIRQQLGRRAAIVRDCAQPPHVVRWVDDERLLVAGADTLSPPARLVDRIAVQRTGQLMYELSTLYPDISGVLPEYGWDAAYARTSDGLPFIGPHRNFPHQLFAFGDSSHSVTGSYLASRILLRCHLDDLDPADASFAFTRYER